MKPTLVIACGALAREIVHLKQAYGWDHMELKCLDARLHNAPHRIADKLRDALEEAGDRYARILIGYADCGTAGDIDRLARAYHAERLPGAHCYEIFAGSSAFLDLAEQHPGTFYLTDFLARYFRRLVIEPLGLVQHPQLRDAYFGNYDRLVYLAQTNDARLRSQAEGAAQFLGLEFHQRFTGYGQLKSELVRIASP
ncbi:MAG: DUF1638 domain-containing protein [Pseudomonadota bacterium]